MQNRHFSNVFTELFWEENIMDGIQNIDIKTCSNVDSYQDVVCATQILLQTNTEWVERYNKYINRIKNNEIIVSQSKRKFRPQMVDSEFRKYISISSMEKDNFIDFRKQGQSVFDVKFAGDKIRFTLKKGLVREEMQWREPGYEKVIREAVKTMNFDTQREHAVESSMNVLMMAPNKRGLFKQYRAINLLRGLPFHMASPVNGAQAKIGILRYSGATSAGIDLFARSNYNKKVSETSFCVIEIKDRFENQEKPDKAIKQAIVYATFIRELLRNPGTDPEDWYRVFVSRLNIKWEANPGLNKPLDIRAIIAMPLDGKELDLSFSGTVLRFTDSTNDTITLQGMDLSLDSNFQVIAVRHY
jgi:hypothetical protein